MPRVGGAALCLYFESNTPGLTYASPPDLHVAPAASQARAAPAEAWPNHTKNTHNRPGAPPPASCTP